MKKMWLPIFVFVVAIFFKRINGLVDSQTESKPDLSKYDREFVQRPFGIYNIQLSRMPVDTTSSNKINEDRKNKYPKAYSASLKNEQNNLNLEYEMKQMNENDKIKLSNILDDFIAPRKIDSPEKDVDISGRLMPDSEDYNRNDMNNLIHEFNFDKTKKHSVILKSGESIIQSDDSFAQKKLQKRSPGLLTDDISILKSDGKVSKIEHVRENENDEKDSEKNFNKRLQLQRNINENKSIDDVTQGDLEITPSNKNITDFLTKQHNPNEVSDNKVTVINMHDIDDEDPFLNKVEDLMRRLDIEGTKKINETEEKKRQAAEKDLLTVISRGETIDNLIDKKVIVDKTTHDVNGFENFRASGDIIKNFINLLKTNSSQNDLEFTERILPKNGGHQNLATEFRDLANVIEVGKQKGDQELESKNLRETNSNELREENKSDDPTHEKLGQKVSDHVESEYNETDLLKTGSGLLDSLVTMFNEKKPEKNGTQFTDKGTFSPEYLYDDETLNENKTVDYLTNSPGKELQQNREAEINNVQLKNVPNENFHKLLPIESSQNRKTKLEFPTEKSNYTNSIDEGKSQIYVNTEIPTRKANRDDELKTKIKKFMQLFNRYKQEGDTEEISEIKEIEEISDRGFTKESNTFTGHNWDEKIRPKIEKVLQEAQKKALKQMRKMEGPKHCVRILNFKNLTYPSAQSISEQFSYYDTVNPLVELKDDHETSMCIDPPKYPYYFLMLQTVRKVKNEKTDEEVIKAVQRKYYDYNGQEIDWEPDLNDELEND